MPTVVTKTIKAPGAGGDQSTLKQAIVDFVKNVDLVTADTAIVLEVYSGVAETGQIVAGDWGTVVTDATRNITIVAPIGHRHTGKWDSGKWRLSYAGGTYGAAALEVAGGVDVVFDHIQIENIGAHSNRPRGIVINTGGSATKAVTLDGCILRSTGSKASPDGGAAVSVKGTTAQSLNVQNSLFVDFPYHLVKEDYSTAGGTYRLYNNTCVGSSQGGVALGSFEGSAHLYAVNMVLQGTGTQYSRIAGTVAFESGILTSDGSTGATIKNTTLTFVNDSLVDYALAQTDTAARNAGFNLYSDANFPVTVDAINVARPDSGVFDLGWLKYISSPSALYLKVVPGGATDGQVFTTQPVVELRDTSNMLVTAATSSVTVSLASGTGTLSGTLVVAAVNGIAAFTDLIISGTGAATLSFAATSLTGAASPSFTVSPLATQLVVTTAPTSAISGDALSPQPIVEVCDASGVVIPGNTTTVTVSVSAGATPSGATSIPAVDGVVTFPNLVLTGSGAVTLTFSAPSLTSDTAPVTVVVGPVVPFVSPVPPATFSTERPPFGGTRHVCADSGDFASALAACNDGSIVAGDIIALAAGVNFVGPFNLRKRPVAGGWVEIRTDISTATLDAACPSGTRMTPTVAAALDLATITAAQGGALTTEFASFGYRLTAVIVEPATSTTETTSLIRFGDSTLLTDSQECSDFIVDRCWIHGSTDTTKSFRRGVWLCGPRMAVIDSWIEDFYDLWTDASDSQAILIACRRGPYIIRNNHLESLSETVMLGGAWWGEVGTGTISCTAGAATFQFAQTTAFIVQNGVILTVNGVQYTISNYTGGNTCTLSGPLGGPTFSNQDFFVGGDPNNLKSAVSDVTITYNHMTRKAIIGQYAGVGTLSATGTAVVFSTPQTLAVRNVILVGGQVYTVTSQGVDASHWNVAPSFPAPVTAVTFGVFPATAGKNGFEIKSCLRAYIAHNIFENVAPQAQYGYCSTMKSAGNPVDSCQDIEYAWNWLRYGAGGIQISGSLRQDNTPPYMSAPSQAVPASRIYVHNCLLEHINDTAPWQEFGDARGTIVSLTTRLSKTTIEHITVVKNAVYSGGKGVDLDDGLLHELATGAITIRNSILQRSFYGIKSSAAEGEASWDYWTNGFGEWDTNVFIGGTDVSTEPDGTHYSADDAHVGYTDLTGGERGYRLVPGSTFSSSGSTPASDGHDIGILNVAAFFDGIASVVTGDYTSTYFGRRSAGGAPSRTGSRSAT